MNSWLVSGPQIFRAMGSITDSSIFSHILIGMLNIMFLLMALKALLALPLSPFTALWKLPVALMFRPRYILFLSVV